MPSLKPAAELAAANAKPYPNDSAEYRRARTALLAEEIELRRHIERVAEMRRALPPGGEAHAYQFYAAIGDDFPRDVHGLAPDGNEWPALDIWTRRDGVVRHFWGGELGGTEDPDQDARGAPDPTPLWNILDLTPAGRGADWYPKLDYPGR